MRNTTGTMAAHHGRHHSPKVGGTFPMNPRPIARLIVGASLVGGVASADPFIAAFEAHDDMHAGALWRNDRPNNNNQRGAGIEHQSITLLKNGRVLVVGTASYTDV